jgi:hypothetical protein
VEAFTLGSENLGQKGLTNFRALTCVFGFWFFMPCSCQVITRLHQHRDDGIGTPELRLVISLHLHRHHRKLYVLTLPNLCIGITCPILVTPFLPVCTYPIESGFLSVVKHCTSVTTVRGFVCVRKLSKAPKQAW